VRDEVAGLAGCDAVSLYFLEGHQHCNGPRPRGGIIGGHGMSDCGQYGFLYVEAPADARPRLWYFEEFSWNATGLVVDRYAEILACVKERGVAGCTARFATAWPLPNATHAPLAAESAVEEMDQ
jgi:hypothetical protein